MRGSDTCTFPQLGCILHAFIKQKRWATSFKYRFCRELKVRHFGAEEQHGALQGSWSVLAVLQRLPREQPAERNLTPLIYCT